jgi:hypothetical protein
VRGFAVAGLEEAARRFGRRRGLRVGAIDETSQVKQGSATAGVKRHYLGCVGKVANGITTVHLAYVRERTGHALIGARQWIPAEQIGDPVTSLVMGLPLDLVFRTTGQLAIDIVTETLTSGITLDFVCGDEVYGACTGLREFLEARGQGYVLRVPSTFRLPLARGVTVTCAPAAARLLAGSRRWEVRSAGAGSQGQRGYAWALLATASPRHHLLVRRHLGRGELAFHSCFVPEGQRVSMARRIRAAGLRWKKISQLARTAAAPASRRSACIPRSPATPCWSWPPWRSAPSPPPYCASAPIPRRQRQCAPISRRPMTLG